MTDEVVAGKHSGHPLHFFDGHAHLIFQSSASEAHHGMHTEHSGQPAHLFNHAHFVSQGSLTKAHDSLHTNAGLVVFLETLVFVVVTISEHSGHPLHEFIHVHFVSQGSLREAHGALHVGLVVFNGSPVVTEHSGQPPHDFTHKHFVSHGCLAEVHKLSHAPVATAAAHWGHPSHEFDHIHLAFQSSVFLEAHHVLHVGDICLPVDTAAVKRASRRTNTTTCPRCSCSILDL